MEKNNPETTYISLAQAAGYSGYSQEYLGLRARQGELRAVKFGRDWVTRKEWLDEYVAKVNGEKIKEPKTEEKVEEQFISLQEAARFCNYSQEYLGLRARQHKLRAVKFGRNWLTKKEWLDDYANNIGDKEGRIEKVIEAEKKEVPGAKPFFSFLPVCRVRWTELSRHGNLI